jgi:hypothetical protein
MSTVLFSLAQPENEKAQALPELSACFCDFIKSILFRDTLYFATIHLSKVEYLGIS